MVSWYPASGNTRKTAIATGSVSITKAGAAKLKIKLTGAARKLLRSQASLKLTATAVFTPTGMAAVSTSRTITIKQ